MACMIWIAALLISALGPAPVWCTLKVWGRGLSLDSADDWLGGRRPCAGQVAVLPDSLAVYLHDQFVVRSVVLPSNGELVFGAGASLALTDRAAAGDISCKNAAGGSTVRFSSTPSRWFDADSWHQAALPSPVPHAERVPCSSGGDAVMFPDNITYRAQVQRDVTVASLRVGQMELDTPRFRSFRDTNLGRALFDVKAGFNVTGAEPLCGSQECACGNDRPEILSVICAATKCPTAPCRDPVQPAGHCCPMCGAYVRASASGDARAAAATLRTLVGRVVGASPVRWHVSATHESHVQVVLVDAAAGRAESARLANLLLGRVRDQAGLSAPLMAASGPRQEALTGGGGGRSAAGPVLAVLCLIILAGLLVWAVRTKRVSLPSASSLHLPPPPSQWHLAERASALAGQLPSVRRRIASAAAAPFQFNFARFRNSTCGSEVELGQRVEELEPTADSATPESTAPESSESVTESGEPPVAPVHASRSFDNPMFGESKPDDHVPATLLAPTSALLVTPDGKAVANPFFGAPDITALDMDDQPPGVPSSPPADSPLAEHSGPDTDAAVEIPPGAETVADGAATGGAAAEEAPTSREEGHGRGQTPAGDGAAARAEEGDANQLLIDVGDSD